MTVSGSVHNGVDGIMSLQATPLYVIVMDKRAVVLTVEP
jgi:hypothetical protein